MDFFLLIAGIALMGLFSWKSMGICRRLKNQHRVATANVAFWLSVTVAYTGALLAG